jgi:chromate transporter
MIYLRLFYEFFKVGLFSVGGGLATIPFLTEMGERTGWFTSVDIANIIAVSQCTPGAIGIDMAVYTGHITAGFWGIIIAPLGLISPAVILILMIAKVLQKYRNSRALEGVFYGLRPASLGLIAMAALKMAQIALVTGAAWTGLGGLRSFLNWRAVLLAAIILICLQIKPLKKLHPMVLVAASALLGILLRI